MAMVAVLFPISDEEPNLEASALEELASLGITSVALLRDSSIAGLVLEGWAFDARDVQRAARAVAGTSDVVQTLRPLVQMSVSAPALTASAAPRSRRVQSASRPKPSSSASRAAASSKSTDIDPGRNASTRRCT